MTAEPTALADHRTTDAGFTLTEVVIVVFLLGLIMPVLALAFSAVVRTTASSEDRADDSRSLLNLTTWLSQDVSSTSEDGFYIGATAPAGGCNLPSSLLASSVNLLELHWREGSENYVTNYRWVPTSSTKGEIIRYACLQGQGAMAVRMTAELNSISTGSFGSAPVEITSTPTEMADGSPGIKGIQVVVLIFDEYGIQRELLSLDATTTNVMTLLPDGTGGPGFNNTPPSTSDLAMTITQGGTKVEQVPMIDENLDPLFVTFPNGLPGAWNILASGVTIEVTPDPAAEPGDYDITYRVTDPSGTWAEAILKVTILAPGPNQAPIANAVSMSASRSRPSVATLVYSDPEGDPLTPVLGPIPAGWTATLSGDQVTVTPSATASGTVTIGYTVKDSVGLTATSQIVVNVCTVSLTSISPASASVFVTSDGNLSEPVTVAIKTNGACGPLVLGFLPDKTSAVEQPESFNASNVVTIKTNNSYAWFKPNGNSTRVVKLNVREGANGPILLSLDLTTKGQP